MYQKYHQSSKSMSFYTMTDARQRSIRALQYYERCTRLRVAFLIEARLCQAAAEGMDGRYFIRGCEFGQCDAGLYVGRGNVDGNATERSFQLLDSQQEQESLVLLDIKSISPRSTYWWSLWQLHAQLGQKEHCQAIILSSAQEPNYVALVPMQYVYPMKSDKGGSPKYYTSGFAHHWILHPLPAFPPELAPFILPLSQLASALANLRTFAQGSGSWSNPYTGACFTKLSPLSLHDGSLLTPLTPKHNTGLADVKVLFEAFKHYSTKFRVELLALAPLLGDCKLVSIPTGEEIIVECKTDHCKLKRTDVPGVQRLLHRACASGSASLIFTWRSQWDYFYTKLYKSDDALFIPRDRIPQRWWNSPASNGEWLQWPATEVWAMYKIDGRTNESLVKGMERILDSNPWRATEPIPLAHVSPESMTEIDSRAHPDPHGGVAEGFSTGRWYKHGFDKGLGSYHHKEMRPESYSVWAAEALMELCRVSGKGLVLDVGPRNPLGRFFVAPYIWSQADKDQYDQELKPPQRAWHFDKHTPIVPVSFLVLRATGSFHAVRVSNSKEWAKSSGGHRPSVVICDLFPYSCMRLPHSRYILPSDQLCQTKVGKKCGSIQPTEGLLEQYQVDGGKVMDMLSHLLDGQEQAMFGIYNTPIRLSDYICNLATVWQAGAVVRGGRQHRYRRLGAHG